MGTITKLKPVPTPKAPKTKAYSFTKVALPPPNKKPNKLPKTRKEAKAGLFQKKDADPIIAMLQDVIQASGLDATKIAVKALLGWTTVNKIIEGTTRRPTNYTCDAILRACGKQRIISNLT